jgi:hypothetical protein
MQEEGQPFAAMNHHAKRNLALALLTTAVTPWTYPLAAATRQSPYAGFGAADISSVVAMRERGRLGHTGPEASAVLDTTRMLEQIRNSTHAERAKVASTVESAVDAASHAVTALQDRSSDLPDASREKFQEAMRKALAMEAQVRGGLQTLRTSTADTHAEARDTLASDYEGYASAVTELESIQISAAGVS